MMIDVTNDHTKLWTLRLLFGQNNFIYWTLCLQDILPTVLFSYWAVRLLLGQFIYKAVCQI